MPTSSVCQEKPLLSTPGFLLFDLSISTFLLILITTFLTLFITSIARVQQEAYDRLLLLTALSERLERFLPAAQPEAVQEFATPYGTLRLVSTYPSPHLPYVQVHATGIKNKLIISIQTGYRL
jgi:hypothetical protein